MRRMQRAQRIAVRLEEGSLEVSGVLGDALSNCSSCSGTLRINFSSEGYLDFPLQPGDPTKCMHFAGSPIRAFLPRVRDGLPSSDMGVLLSPLLRVQGVRRVQARSVKLFVVFKDASNKLFVRG